MALPPSRVYETNVHSVTRPTSVQTMPPRNRNQEPWNLPYPTDRRIESKLPSRPPCLVGHPVRTAQWAPVSPSNGQVSLATDRDAGHIKLPPREAYNQYNETTLAPTGQGLMEMSAYPPLPFEQLAQIPDPRQPSTRVTQAAFTTDNTPVPGSDPQFTSVNTMRRGPQARYAVGYEQGALQWR